MSTSHWMKLGLSAISGLALTAASSAASAQTTTVTAEPVQTVQTAPAQQTVTSEEAYVPNRYLLTTGFILWGVPYVSGVIVAAQSSNQADQHLYVPIAGPWIDLANRGGCPAGNASCDTETTNKVLLGLDGVFQAVGTLEVIWGFLKPEHRTYTRVQATKYTPEFTWSPAKLGSGYGLAAVGSF